jgi:hypothetical protein
MRKALNLKLNQVDPRVKTLADILAIRYNPNLSEEQKTIRIQNTIEKASISDQAKRQLLEKFLK